MSGAQNNQDIVRSYNAVPYINQAFRFTHPERLETIGLLFGLEPPSAEKSRVLEIGCSDGLNLAAMAYGLPSSKFVGLDLSETQLATGRQFITELGLNNVELLQRDVTSYTAPEEKFDYIICHGMFSWVTPEVQHAIFSLCQNGLSSHGIAYISFNTYPGWHFREPIRDLMLFHAKQFTDEAMFIKQSRAMGALFSRALKDIDAPLSQYLRNTLEDIRLQPDWYLRHDVLEERNVPLYFAEFVALANAHKLQYLGDAEVSKMMDFSLPEDVRESLRKITCDLIRYEQYLDFFRNRGFRRALLCKDSTTIQRDIWRERLPELCVASHCRPLAIQRSSRSTLTSDGMPVQVADCGKPVVFCTESGIEIELIDPLEIALLSCLYEEFPQYLAYQDLLERALTRTEAGKRKKARKEYEEQITDFLWACFSRDLVEFSPRRGRYSTLVSAKPRASLLAREQARSSLEVTNLRHEVICLEESTAMLLRLLSGERSKNDILQQLSVSGSTDEATALNEEWLTETLALFAKNALLEG